MIAVTFLHPWAFALLLVLPVIWLTRGRDRLHVALRTAALLLVVLGLARPVTVTRDEAEHHVLIVDGSGGAGAAGELLDRLPAEARVTVIPTGDADVADFDRHPRVAAVLPRPGDDSPLGTALAVAGTRIPDGAAGAVTLFSDGLATDRHWGAAVEALSARGIPVYVAALERPAGDVRPVAIATSGPLRVGRTERLLVDVVGEAVEFRLVLSGPDGLLAETGTYRIEDAGRLRAAVEFEPAAAGFLPVTATVEVVSGSDSDPGNNALATTVAIQDPVRVLYLGERVAGGADRLAGLVGPGFSIETPTASGGRDPRAFDLVVLDDRPARSVPAELQARIADAVTNDGTGLIAAGGGAAFGPGGYQDTPLADVLPVEFVQKEEKKDPSTALAVIIDTSGSMGGNRVILAKEVARLAIRRLLPHDKIGIVEFYGTKRWAAPLQSAANSLDIQRALNRLDAGGGTVLFPALEEAYYGLRNVQTRYKHVLLLTDAGVETGPYEALLRRMAKDGICVSTVLCGPGRHSEFLVQLADWGNGRYYNASNRFNLPEIMLKQPSGSRLPAYRPGPHALRSRGGAGWWGRTNSAAMPVLDGYVETRVRDGAEVVIRTAKEEHPVLASWRYGLGRVTAFMTEPTGPGTRSWRDWDGYGPLLARVMARTASESRLPFAYSIERRRGVVRVTAVRTTPGVGTPAARVVTGDALRFRERADGVFTADAAVAPADELRVEAGAPGSGFRLVSPAFADRSPEGNVDPDRALDAEVLARATGGTAGTLATFTDFVPAAAGAIDPVAALALWPWCLLLALLFWLADLAWRRSPWYTVAD